LNHVKRRRWNRPVIPGRDAIDPRILMGLWLYATLDAVGSARQLARRSGDPVAYRWICGGVSVNYHTLSEFRTAPPELLDELLTQSVAALMPEGLVTLHRVAQDGMRVRANAGASSFRRRPSLEECPRQAQQQVQSLHQELEAAPAARGTKMPDGGFRPTHNVELATDTASQVITGVDVVNAGSDTGQMPPMMEQHQGRSGKTPDEILADGGFAQLDAIEKVSSAPVGATV
jgi:transposase